MNEFNKFENYLEFTESPFAKTEWNSDLVIDPRYESKGGSNLTPKKKVRKKRVKNKRNK